MAASADGEVARFSTSELEKAVPGIILGTDSHEKLQELIEEAIKSKTMYFDMNQAGETPRSLPRPRNGAFFPDEVSLSVPWKWGKPLQLPSRHPLLLPGQAQLGISAASWATRRGEGPGQPVEEVATPRCLPRSLAPELGCHCPSSRSVCRLLFGNSGPSLCLSFLTCEMGVIVVFTPQSCCEDKMR